MTVSSFQNPSFFSGSATASSYTRYGGVQVADLYNTDNLDNRYNYQNARESYELADTGRDAAISTYINNISSYLKSGQEDKAIAEYEALLAQMNTQDRYAQLVSEDGNDTQLRAVARQIIEIQIGGSLENYIRENSRDAIGVEKQKLYRGEFCDSTTQEDLLEAMCNIKEDEGHLNGFQKVFHGFFGSIARGWNAIFGDGKKH